MRIIAALSGGVDSSVAAARMVDQGHDVVGVHLALARSESTGESLAAVALSTMHAMRAESPTHSAFRSTSGISLPNSPRK